MVRQGVSEGNVERAGVGGRIWRSGTGRAVDVDDASVVSKGSSVITTGLGPYRRQSVERTVKRIRLADATYL